MTQPPLKKRPFGVTLLLWLVLTLVAWGGVRFLSAMRGWAVMTEYHASLAPGYLAITGLLWFLAGGTLGWSIFTGQPWTVRALWAASLLWLIEYWVERTLFFQTADPNLWFAITSSALVFGSILVITLHKNTQDFLTGSEAYEQQDENSDSQ